jgi:hypothetical protein
VSDDFEGLVPEHLYAPPPPEPVELDGEPEPGAMRHRGRRLVAAAAVIALIVAGAWVATRSTPHGHVTIAGIADGTAAAKTAHFHGEMSAVLADETIGPILVTDGEVDFGAHAGTSTIKIDFAELASAMPSATAVSGLPTPSSVTMHEIWRADDVWTDNDFAGLMLGQPTSNGAKWLHSHTSGATDRVGMSLVAPMTDGATPGIDPTSLLESLRASGIALSEAGHDSIDGVDTTKYTASASITQLTSDASDENDAKAALTLFVDGQDRVRRVTLVQPAAHNVPGGDMTLDFSDFGGSVDVQPPPAGEVVESPLGDSQSSSGTAATVPSIDDNAKLTGPWTTLRSSGDDAGVAWELYRAPATNGESCYALHTEPNVDIDASSDGAPNDVEHGGDPVTCASDGASSPSPLFGPAQLGFQSSKSATTSVVVILAVPDATPVTATRPDGTTDSLTVDHGTAVDIVTVVRAPTKITIGTGTSTVICRTTPPAGIPQGIPNGGCLPASMDDLLQGPGALSGSWTDVFHAPVADVDVRVVRAPARTGWSCFAVVTDPNVAMSARSQLLALPGGPSYQGHPSTCGPDHVAGSLLGGFVGSVTSVLAYTASDPSVTLAVLHEPDYSHAEAKVGGTTTTLPINSDGIVVYVGPARTSVAITLSGGGPTVTCSGLANSLGAIAPGESSSTVPFAFPDTMLCNPADSSTPSP